MMRAGLVRLAWVWDHSIGFVLTWMLILPILGYQRLIAPILPPSCRYYPSCSAYAIGSLRTHGALKGFVLASWRLLRCNPWSPGGIDRVPSRGMWRPSLEGEHVDH